MRAGIFSAGRIIMLASESVAEGDGGETGMDHLVDAGSIFAYKLVRTLNRNASVVVEIVHRQNMAFMGDQQKESGFSNYRMSPQFASGSLFTSSMLDTLICQQFYNPELTSIVAQLISGMDREKETLYWRAILGNTDPVIDEMRGSVLIQISVPDDYIGKHYSEMVHQLLSDNRVAIGLYRDPDGQAKIGGGFNRLPYVVTNPSKDTILTCNDMVFILDQNPSGARGEIQKIVSTVNTFVIEKRKSINKVAQLSLTESSLESESLMPEGEEEK